MRIAALLLLGVALTAEAAHPQHRTAHPTLAPGYGDLEFDPPAPGSYRLPGLGPANDAAIVDTTGKRLRLHDLMGDRIVLLSFIYTQCTDVNGCPLATHVLARIQNRLLDTGRLAGAIRLISFSFDPRNDTPRTLSRYAANFRKPGVDWRFVTVSDPGTLDTVLEDYGQFIVQARNDRGELTGSFSHALRVFLIDRRRIIRNIYSVSFLHPDTVMNDIRTVMTNNPTGAPGELD